jgi:hypothetical protein
MLEKERSRNSLAGEAFHRQLQAAQERKSAIVLKKVNRRLFGRDLKSSKPSLNNLCVSHPIRNTKICGVYITPLKNPRFG